VIRKVVGGNIHLSNKGHSHYGRAFDASGDFVDDGALVHGEGRVHRVVNGRLGAEMIVRHGVHLSSGVVEDLNGDLLILASVDHDVDSSPHTGSICRRGLSLVPLTRQLCRTIVRPESDDFQ